MHILCTEAFNSETMIRTFQQVFVLEIMSRAIPRNKPALFQDCYVYSEKNLFQCVSSTFKQKKLHPPPFPRLKIASYIIENVC